MKFETRVDGRGGETSGAVSLYQPRVSEGVHRVIRLIFRVCPSNELVCTNKQNTL